jgi:hypothetical protein
MRRGLFLVPILAVSIARFGSAQSPESVLGNNLDYLDVVHGHLRWPAPESIANGLRSSDEKLRLRALHLMGFTDDQAYRPVWSLSTPSQVVGKKLVTPDQIRLTYAALGDSDVKQAILAVFIADLQITAMTVAVPIAGGWERIARADCWCKYEMGNGLDTLAVFQQLQLAPGSASPPLRFELVVHASGGGTGFYYQTETHFRVYKGDLIQVLSFTSRHRDCNVGIGNPSKPGCILERRWYFPAQFADGPGAVLVHGYGEPVGEGQVPASLFLEEGDIRNLQRLQCTTFKWDPRRFRYKQLEEEANPCSTAAR